MVKEVFEAEKIYIYLSSDGVTRQRCGQHVSLERKLMPVKVWKVISAKGKRTCIECIYEGVQHQLMGGENVAGDDDDDLGTR